MQAKYVPTRWQMADCSRSQLADQGKGRPLSLQRGPTTLLLKALHRTQSLRDAQSCLDSLGDPTGTGSQITGPDFQRRCPRKVPERHLGWEELG